MSNSNFKKFLEYFIHNNGWAIGNSSRDKYNCFIGMLAVMDNFEVGTHVKSFRSAFKKVNPKWPTNVVDYRWLEYYFENNEDLILKSLKDSIIEYSKTL
jgi:hypothetical protein